LSIRNNKDFRAIVNDESTAFAKASIIGGGINTIPHRGSLDRARAPSANRHSTSALYEWGRQILCLQSRCAAPGRSERQCRHLRRDQMRSGWSCNANGSRRRGPTAHDPGRCDYEPAGDTCTLVSVLGLRNRSNTIGSSSSGTTEVMSIFGSAWPLSITSATY
jgi:hypothetical protein